MRQLSDQPLSELASHRHFRRQVVHAQNKFMQLLA
jgi:hypothetical protein